ncbi:oxygen-independent coproporphyrinogen III oxidase [Pseudomonas cavernicola]|uniref:Coproporphyrinogen-III oxidase n=1 Tax=Pseudomonas cavernicola TaxID=2320866 RepID=A0A418X980_9PSED|nr:oxygen-independent coproporphyrinogen III oxidase [Pseudomonas cavernicola]RJG08923.1 oxygen-independent coproporphyrinogen III oxidase [Pseudomonas cavernicola]
MLDFIRWDSKLIDRYDQADPNYSGYPEAIHFHRGIGSLDLLRALRSSRQAQLPLSLYVQLPFCGNRRSFGDDQDPTGERSNISSYLHRLECEINLISSHLGPRQWVQQFHLGGGVPGAAELRWLMSHLRKRFNWPNFDSGDYNIEIDPPHADWSTMGFLSEQGFNHVSIGVPDSDMTDMGAVAYFQSSAQIRSLIDAARTLHYRSVNVDLGFGRLWQTPASFARKVAAIIELQPDRLTVFDYAYPPQRYKLRRWVAAGGLSCREDKLVMRQHCIKELTAAGYRFIGMGQFVLPDDDLAIAQESGRLQRSCQGYTRHGRCDHVGLGVSAISQIGDLYVQNTSDLERYQEQLNMGQLATDRGLRCEAVDLVRREVIERLVCDFELDLRSIDDRYGLVFRDYFSASWPLLKQMDRDGLIVLGDDFISIPPAGRLLVGAVCKAFEHDTDAHSPKALRRSSADQRVAADRKLTQ